MRRPGSHSNIPSTSGGEAKWTLSRWEKLNTKSAGPGAAGGLSWDSGQSCGLFQAGAVREAAEWYFRANGGARSVHLCLRLTRKALPVRYRRERWESVLA